MAFVRVGGACAALAILSCWWGVPTAEAFVHPLQLGGHVASLAGGIAGAKSRGATWGRAAPMRLLSAPKRAAVLGGMKMEEPDLPYVERSVHRLGRKGGMLKNQVKEPFVSDGELVAERCIIKPGGYQAEKQHAFIRAGPREEIAFSGEETKIGIVTCGGLCPGLNNVVREIAREAHSLYGVPVGNVFGIRNGFGGFTDKNRKPIVLTPEFLENIHNVGGSALGSARGGFDAKKIIDAAQEMGLNMMFIIGGDGTHAAAMKLDEEAQSRGMRLSVVGVPKTIDNDIKLIDKSFGFDTAVQEAVRAIKCAKVEAIASLNGIGVVRLMGRNCGFLTAFASLSSNDVDLCIIPEAPLELEPLVEYVRDTLKRKGHMTITIAEGTQIPSDIAKGKDEKKGATGGDVGMAGTASISVDVGRWLVDTLNKKLGEDKSTAPSIRYIDPSYMVRSVPANVGDSAYCALLASQAVHGAFAGYTGFTVGLINNRSVLIPMWMIAGQNRKVDINGRFWYRVLSSTGQPSLG